MKSKPANLAKTIGRLWPSLLLLPFQFLRHGRGALFFRHPFAHITGQVVYGRFAEIGAYSFLNAGPHGISIGSFSQINPHVSLIGNVHIGNRVLIAPSSVLASGGHKFGKGIEPRFSGGGKEKIIRIEDDVWIGANVTIIGEVIIGRGSVIAAGVTIDRSVPPETLVRRSATSFVFEFIR